MIFLIFHKSDKKLEEVNSKSFEKVINSTFTMRNIKFSLPNILLKNMGFYYHTDRDFIFLIVDIQIFNFNMFNIYFKEIKDNDIFLDNVRAVLRDKKLNSLI